MLPRRGGRKEAQGAPVEGRGGAHAEELQTRLHLLRTDRGPSKHLLSFNPQESGRETLPCPRLRGGGLTPVPRLEGAAPGLPPNLGLSVAWRGIRDAHAFQPTGGEDPPHNQFAFFPQISRK